MRISNILISATAIAAVACSQNGGQTGGQKAADSTQTNAAAKPSEQAPAAETAKPALSVMDAIRKVVELCPDEFVVPKDKMQFEDEQEWAFGDNGGEEGTCYSAITAYPRADGKFFAFLHSYLGEGDGGGEICSKFYILDPAANTLTPIESPIPAQTKENLVDFLTVPDLVGSSKLDELFKDVKSQDGYAVWGKSEGLEPTLKIEDWDTGKFWTNQVQRYEVKGNEFVLNPEAPVVRAIAQGAFGEIKCGDPMPGEIPGCQLQKDDSDSMMPVVTYSKAGKKVLQVIGYDGKVSAIRCFSPRYVNTDYGYHVGSPVNVIMRDNEGNYTISPVMTEGEDIPGMRLSLEGVDYYFDSKALTGGKQEEVSEGVGKIIDPVVADGTLVLMIETSN